MSAAAHPLSKPLSWATSIRIRRAGARACSSSRYDRAVVESPIQHNGHGAGAAVPEQPQDDSAVEAGTVVLEPTRRGREELEQRRFGLGANQRRLLALLDGERSLQHCAQAEPQLQRPRLARDAARLVAFGLARQVHGELPQHLIVAAMNLTARIPLDQLRPLDPERVVAPMAPRVAPSPNRRPVPEDGAPPPVEQSYRLLAVLAALLAAAVVAISYFG